MLAGMALGEVELPRHFPVVQPVRCPDSLDCVRQRIQSLRKEPWTCYAKAWYNMICRNCNLS